MLVKPGQPSSAMRRTFAVLAALTLLPCHCMAFNLPGTAPHNYHDGDFVDVQVNVLSSVNTHLPYDYYSVESFCHPTKKFRGEPENLGEILMGDRIKPSPYENIVVGQNVDCAVLCEPQEQTEKAKKKLTDMIKDDYLVNLIADNLPLAVVHADTGTYSVGAPLGAEEGGEVYVYNHFHFSIKYYELTFDEVEKHREALEKAAKKKATSPAAAGTTESPLIEEETLEIKRIIAFVVTPYSVDHDPAKPEATCAAGKFDPVKMKPLKSTANKIVFSYGVKWEQTEDKWATRWDVYLNTADHDIHWFSIINSVLIVLLLTAIIAFIFLRALRRDISKYNRLDLDPEDFQEETGWKLVHKDVFRPPEYTWLLAALNGTGAQLVGMTVTVLLFAVLGFLAPSNRGALFTAMLVCFVFLGMYAGYTSARLLKLWGVPSWANIFAAATIVPGVAFGVFFIVNLLVWAKGSSGAVPFVTMLAVIAMWFCISLPLVFVGAVFGFKRESIKLPVMTTQIPRHIPEASWHMHPAFTITVAGVLPFGSVFIEVFFILTAVWLNRYYYVFGFLALVFIILFITCAEITIVMTYFQLCVEDYRWWWRSFLTSGSCGGYLFLYSVFYFFSSPLRMKSFVPIFLYFSYMSLLSFIFFVMTGTVGFMATFAFVRYIYGVLKVN